MLPSKQLRFLLLQVITPHYHRSGALANMVETQQLVDTYGGVVVEKDIQHRVAPHSATYIGPGKVKQLLETVKQKNIDVVVLNDLVNSGQLFRVEKVLWGLGRSVKVWDRIDLILNIFEKHAVSVGAKLQIELARIDHEGPRIYGLGKTALSRQGGGIGTRGLGETNIERERRLIKDRKRTIRKELEKLANQKQNHIHGRMEKGMGPVALVGYTSAGKTSLFNALTGRQKLTHTGLFTTLDTVVGKMKSAPGQMPIIVSDTIGFIHNLPPTLVDAFRSTLLESLQAKLLLHVVDSADPRLDEKIMVVEEILKDLKATQPTLLVFSKTDTIDRQRIEMLTKTYNHIPVQFVSAQTGFGLAQLKQTIISDICR